MTTTDKILVPALDAAKLLSMGRSTFWREVAKGTIPAPVKIGGLEQAARSGQWQPRPASEQRRLGLVPPPYGVDWDSLMVQPRYMRSLDLIP